MDADNFLQAIRGDDFVLGRKGERADSGGERFSLEDPRGKGGGGGGVDGGRGMSVEKAGKRAADSGKGGAEAAGGMVIANLRGAEVNRGGCAVVEVIAKN